MNTTNHSMLEAATAIKSLRPFIGWQQLDAVGDLCRGEERQFFKNKLVELAALVGAMPKTYETDGQGKQAIAQLHYFTGDCDWYITERDCEDRQLQAFGLANMGYGAELGYISLEEILACGAELDLHWTPKTLAEIKLITG
jgi:hypothetical protein